ncbi:MAG: thiamine diphosphokinase [Bacteroidales bacterium]|nr:thiamine diphosphokinase [Bacteroidales bacterium]
MNTAVIVCNGEFPKKEYPRYLIKTADLVICCDSARNVARLEALGRTPDLLVGDMDSTPAKVRERMAGRVVSVEEQDDNDLAKAFALIRDRYPEIKEIHIVGAGGKNEAHTVGNLGWLMEWERRSLAETCLGLAARGINVDMISDWTTAFAVSPAAAGDTASLEAVELFVGEGRRVSFFATDPELRISSQGLQWPLDGVDLTQWWGATLNRASTPAISLRFNKKSPLLVVLD